MMSGFGKSFSTALFLLFVCLVFAGSVASRPGIAATAFAPSQISDMSAWFDASVPGGLTLFGKNVATWKDASGLGNNLAQGDATYEPTYVTSGIDGLGSVAFAGRNFLITANGAFSSELFNESTTFTSRARPERFRASRYRAGFTMPTRASKRSWVRAERRTSISTTTGTEA